MLRAVRVALLAAVFLAGWLTGGRETERAARLPEDLFEWSAPAGTPLMSVDTRGNLWLGVAIEAVVYTPRHPQSGLSRRCNASVRDARASGALHVVCFESDEIYRAMVPP